MRSPAHSAEPPRAATWLVHLFAFAEEAESILGDLFEEFSHLASKSGVPFARRWYWRQTVKTVWHLAAISFRAHPSSTTAAIVGGFLLRRLLGPLVTPATFAVLERYQVFEHHFSTYLFFASTGIDIGHVITFLFIGLVVAFAARGREMISTMTLGIVYGTMAVAGSVYVVTRTGDDASLWRLTWYFADSFSMVLAGVIVRMRRSTSASRFTIRNSTRN